jgi:polar amino acid transport system substrate-binding protein
LFTRTFRLALPALAVVALLAACSGGASPSPSGGPSGGAASITPPQAITDAGKLVFCVDISYPPEEFFAADGTTAQGSDIDIATDIAKRFGVTAQIDNTGFDGIIPALKAEKCDLIISGMNSTEERKQEVDFVDYLKVGQGVLVPAGNPDGITTLEDLSGKSVAVQLGTTNAESLEAVNETLAAAGKDPIDIQTFQQDTDAFQQLTLGRVAAYTVDSVVMAYYITLPENKDKFEIAANIDPIPIGIAVRKENTELRDAVQKAIDAMYADGSLRQIVEKWGMTSAVEFLK